MTMRALNRSLAEWPDRDDIEFYAAKNPRYFPYDSVEAAQVEIAKYHQNEIEKSRISDIARTIQFRAVTGFLMHTGALKDEYEQRRIVNDVESLMLEADLSGVETWNDKPVAKIIVLTVNESPGLVQLRCDHPEDEHLHIDETMPSDEAFYTYYKQQAENFVGHAFEPLEIEGSLEKVLKAVP